MLASFLLFFWQGGGDINIQLEKYIKNKKLLDFIQITQKRMMQAEIGTSAVVVAYYLLLSLFPLLLTVGNILPLLNLNPQTVLPYIEELMPSEIFNQLEPAFVNLLTQSNTSVLSLSAIVTLWSASRSVNALQEAMNKAYGVEPRSNFLVTKVVSFFMMILIVVSVVGVVVVLGIGQQILDWLQTVFGFSLTIVDTFSALKWPVVVAGLIIVMCLIYRLLPNAKIRILSVLPGALFTSLGWIALSQVFSLYLNYFSPAMASYQIIGSFIILMIWLNLASTMIILGGIINAVVAEFRSGKQLVERERLYRKIYRRFKKS